MHLDFFQILKPNNRKVAPAPVESWQGLQQLEPRLLLSGTITAWGDDGNGGSGAPTDSGYTQISANWQAFAALKEDGSVVTWGSANRGGNSSNVADSLSSGVSTIFSNTHAFAALKEDGSVHTWGSIYGGDTDSVHGFETSQSKLGHILMPQIQGIIVVKVA